MIGWSVWSGLRNCIFGKSGRLLFLWNFMRFGFGKVLYLCRIVFVKFVFWIGWWLMKSIVSGILSYFRVSRLCFVGNLECISVLLWIVFSLFVKCRVIGNGCC